jgi:creatinine amidohydrolase
VVGTAWSRFGQPEGISAPEESLYGIHGGDIETSIMLHLRPDLVRMALAEDFRSHQLSFLREFKHLRAHGLSQFGWKAQDLNPKGAVGNASAATAEKGRAVVDYQAHAFVDLCRDVDAFDVARLWKPAAD